MSGGILIFFSSFIFSLPDARNLDSSSFSIHEDLWWNISMIWKSMSSYASAIWAFMLCFHPWMQAQYLKPCLTLAFISNYKRIMFDSKFTCWQTLKLEFCYSRKCFQASRINQRSSKLDFPSHFCSHSFVSGVSLGVTFMMSRES